MDSKSHLVDSNKPLVPSMVVNNHPLIYSLVDGYYSLVTPLVDGVKHLVTFCVHGNYSLVNSLVDGSISLVYVSLYGNTATIAAHCYRWHNSELILAFFHLLCYYNTNFLNTKICSIYMYKRNNGNGSEITSYRQHNTEVQYESTTIKYLQKLYITPFSISQSTSVELQHQGFMGMIYDKLIKDNGDSTLLQRLTES